jgi:hypothetical protein
MHLAPLRFAVLHEDGRLATWQARCLDELLLLGDVRVQLLLTRRAGAAVSEVLASVGRILLPDSPAPDPENPATRAAVARVKKQPLDFALSFLEEGCPADLLDAPRYGVWRFAFGDWTHYRGQPTGFWEVYEGASVTGALLARELPQRDALIVLREGYLRTDLRSCALNRTRIEERVARWPAQICVDIRNGVVERFSSAPLIAGAAPRQPPTRLQRARCQALRAVRAARLAWRALFRHDQWNVGLVDQPIAAFLRHEKRAAVRWLAPGTRDEMRADPFGVMRDGHLSILCEQMSYRENRGYIVAIESMNAGDATRVAIGPVSRVHMSYPYLLQIQERILCIPETSAAKDVALYESEHFPDRWVKVATLVTGVELVDATLFEFDGYWWLAASEVADRGANCELHLWYARNLIGPWQPHVGNPVKIDVRSARPAGTPFVVDGSLYRPAQDCSRTYGGRVIINRVHTLTPIAFREEAFAYVDPDPAGPYPEGLHTLSRVGNATLIDGKREIFIPAEFSRVLMKKVTSLLNRPRAATH